ncbi:MAG TPA: VCBS repeat-containing protein [bacterium]|nr:VCBS repeat-containing protein [bacterium]
MTTTHEKAPGGRILNVVVLGVVFGSGAIAQTANPSPPFDQPAFKDVFSLSSIKAVLDINRDGSLDLVTPSLFFGTLLTTLDENGDPLELNVTGPAFASLPGGNVFTQGIALASGDLDEDGYDDLVAISNDGGLHWLRNLGNHDTAGSFAPDVLLDDLRPLLPLASTFSAYSFPCLKVLDIDGDSHLDLLVGGGVIDSWTGTAGPGLVTCYLGDGRGAFSSQTIALSGHVIDAEWADVDGDGAAETIVALTEDGAAGIFPTELQHLRPNGSALVMTSAPQVIGAGRNTAIEIADLTGDGLPDYIVAEVQLLGGTANGQVYCYAGDGTGLLTGTWNVLSLPPNPATATYVPSVQVDDFDRDGDLDVALLRGTLTAVPSFANNAPYGTAEVITFYGPDITTQTPTVTPLAAQLAFSWVDSPLFGLRPLASQPDFLDTIDLGRDRRADLLVTGLRTVTQSTQVSIATLQNLAPPQTGDTGYTRLGAPSGVSAARIGFDGGLPQLGNQDFACTIQDVRGGCVVGLMWGDWGQENLVFVHGFMLHLAPTQFGYAAITSGNGADDGFYRYPLPIPANPALLGDAGYFQYNYYDHVADSFGGTQATGVRIGS